VPYKWQWAKSETWVKKSVNSNRQLCAQYIVLDMARGIANDQ